MRKVILFIAMSLDGYIADRDGKVDWLQGQEPDGDDMTGYDEFIKDVDTVIMGWNTYHQVAVELSPERWLYKDLTSYVMTHREVPAAEGIHFINGDVCELVQSLKEEEGKNIWICGGAGVIHPLVRERLIDRFHISIIPTILGNGIRLFEDADSGIELRLMKTDSYNGITDLVYEYR